MKKIIYVLLLLASIYLAYYNREDLATYIFKYQNNKKEVSTIVNNDYKYNENYSYVKLTDNFIVQSRQDILNVIYTILNSGMDKFIFYCSDEYQNCMNDINEISKDRTTLSTINNYVHPYNSFSDIETTRYENTGRVELVVNHLYNSDEINKIDNEVDKIIKEKITDDMNDKAKIKTIHDYIINNTKYDKDKSDKNITKYKSDTAYGPLFEGYGICNGYADLMNIFLHKLNIKSIKISSENHIWNLVYLDNSWYHLDLTWDDPIMENGKDIIDYSYFLITNDELFELSDSQHYYNKDIYKEAY